MFSFIFYNNLFKFVCCTTACCMIGYWIHKYMKNEDVSLIEYKSFAETDSVSLPALTICFFNPFLNSELESLHDNVTNETYLQYLIGEKNSNQKYRHIKYEEVTLNLSDYIRGILIGFRPGKNKPITENCLNADSCSYVSIQRNYDGFAGKDLLKCFAIQVKQIYSKDVAFLMISFKKTFSSILKQLKEVAVFSNNPWQLLRNN